MFISVLILEGMKKETAIKAFGSPAALARALGISPAAVYQWGEDVPRLRVYELRELGVPEEGVCEANEPSPASYTPLAS